MSLAAATGSFSKCIACAAVLRRSTDPKSFPSNFALKARIEAIRLQAGPMMMLGDVSDNSVPKMMLVSPPQNGGAVTVRSFIPKRAHATVGVLGAVSVATACLLEGSPAAEVADVPAGRGKTISVEHPTGEMTCVLETDEAGNVMTAALLRTARKLMDGRVFA